MNSTPLNYARADPSGYCRGEMAESIMSQDIGNGIGSPHR